MEQLRIVCDKCGRDVRDPKDWLLVLHGLHYGELQVQIQRLNGSSQSKLVRKHYCGIECLTRALPELVADFTPKKRAKERKKRGWIDPVHEATKAVTE